MIKREKGFLRLSHYKANPYNQLISLIDRIKILRDHFKTISDHYKTIKKNNFRTLNDHLKSVCEIKSESNHFRLQLQVITLTKSLYSTVGWYNHS